MIFPHRFFRNKVQDCTGYASQGWKACAIFRCWVSFHRPNSCNYVVCLRHVSFFEFHSSWVFEGPLWVSWAIGMFVLRSICEVCCSVLGCIKIFLIRTYFGIFIFFCCWGWRWTRGYDSFLKACMLLLSFKCFEFYYFSSRIKSIVFTCLTDEKW